MNMAGYSGDSTSSWTTIYYDFSYQKIVISCRNIQPCSCWWECTDIESHPPHSNQCGGGEWEGFALGSRYVLALTLPGPRYSYSSSRNFNDYWQTIERYSITSILVKLFDGFLSFTNNRLKYTFDSTNTTNTPTLISISECVHKQSPYL